jgi:hypothetical protein
MVAGQPQRGRSQGREAPRNEGNLDAEAERRLSASPIVLARTLALTSPLHPFS